MTIKSRVIEKPVSEDVRLRNERVYITRKPVNREVSNTAAFDEKTISMTETAEEVVVQKFTHVVEEIELNKYVNYETETVNETLKETKVDIVDTTDEAVTRELETELGE